MFVKRGTNIHFLKRNQGVIIVLFFLEFPQQKVCPDLIIGLSEDHKAITIPGFLYSRFHHKNKPDFMCASTQRES
jgi:hypothetical protein